MKNWIIGILGIVVIGVLADVILSDSQVGKFIKKIFGVASVLMILYPISDLLNLNIDNFFEYEFKQDNQYLEYVSNTQKEYLEYYLEKTLATNGFENIDVEILYNLSGNVSEIEKVILNLQNLVINENVTHINKYEEIKKIVSVTVKVKEEKIILNE